MVGQRRAPDHEPDPFHCLGRRELDRVEFARHATWTRTLRLEFDDIPERIVEIPAPESPRPQDWLTTSPARAAECPASAKE